MCFFWKVYDIKRIGFLYREKNYIIDVDFIEEDDELFDGDFSFGIYGGEVSFIFEDLNIEEEEDCFGEDYYILIDDVGSSSGNVDDDEEIGDSFGIIDELEEDLFLLEKILELIYFIGKGKEKEGFFDNEDFGVWKFFEDICVDYDGIFGVIIIDSIFKYILKVEFENNFYGFIFIIIYFVDDYKILRLVIGVNLFDSEFIISGVESIVGDINDFKMYGSIDDLIEDKVDLFLWVLVNNDEDFEKMIDK